VETVHYIVGRWKIELEPVNTAVRHLRAKVELRLADFALHLADVMHGIRNTKARRMSAHANGDWLIQTNSNNVRGVTSRGSVRRLMLTQESGAKNTATMEPVLFVDMKEGWFTTTVTRLVIIVDIFAGFVIPAWACLRMTSHYYGRPQIT
jgi:hypothetical protein